ncbi:MAG TPA: hypothetical protein VLW45_12700 [Pelomicrobium sp.]|nr:hypothetical protein [Pelomicrobium sp.]
MKNAMQRLLKMLKINNLQYNANRDPEVYRRAVNKPFRIQAVLAGSGTARCQLVDAAGKVVADKSLQLPGTFTHELSYGAPGVHVLRLKVEGGGQVAEQDLRLDVVEHDWIG